jgi:hypothetical protein
MIGQLRAQLEEQVPVKNATPLSAEQFLITLAGSCLFPFVARPMIVELLGLGAKAFDGFMEQRRTDLPAFLKRAIQ